MSKISDIGKAESQPISREVLECAQEEIARLSREVARLTKALEEYQKRLLKTW